MELTPKGFVTKIFERAGIRIGGDAPWDITVHHPRFFRRVLRGSIGLGESYTDGDWDTPQLDATIRRLLRTGASSSTLARTGRILKDLRSRVANLQTRPRSRAVPNSIMTSITVFTHSSSARITNTLVVSSTALTISGWRKSANWRCCATSSRSVPMTGSSILAADGEALSVMPREPAVARQ